MEDAETRETDRGEKLKFKEVISKGVQQDLDRLTQLHPELAKAIARRGRSIVDAGRSLGDRLRLLTTLKKEDLQSRNRTAMDIVRHELQLNLGVTAGDLEKKHPEIDQLNFALALMSLEEDGVVIRVPDSVPTIFTRRS